MNNPIIPMRERAFMKAATQADEAEIQNRLDRMGINIELSHYRRVALVQALVESGQTHLADSSKRPWDDLTNDEIHAIAKGGFR